MYEDSIMKPTLRGANVRWMDGTNGRKTVEMALGMNDRCNPVP
jgi:hypothetical protein